VRDELAASCVLGESFIRTFYDDYVAEMRQAANPAGKGGIAVISPKLRSVAQELGLPIPDRLASQVAEARVNAYGAEGSAAAVTAKMQCTSCGEFINLVDGQPPKMCRFCGQQFGEQIPAGAIAGPVPQQSAPAVPTPEQSADWSDGASDAQGAAEVEESPIEAPAAVETAPAAEPETPFAGESETPFSDETPTKPLTPRRKKNS